MIFNGIKKEYISVSAKFTLPARSEIEHISQPHKDSGFRIKRSRLKELYITVPVIVQSDQMSIDEVKVDVNDWLTHTEDKVLSFNFYPKYHYKARLSKIEWNDETNNVMTGIIEFVCEEPYRFGETQELLLNTSHKVFNIGGQSEVSWESETTFTVPQSSYILEFDNGGKIELNYQFITGDLLKIDYKTRDIKLNDTDLSVALSLESNWKTVHPGNAKIRASHQTTLSYTEGYF